MDLHNVPDGHSNIPDPKQSVYEDSRISRISFGVKTRAFLNLVFLPFIINFYYSIFNFKYITQKTLKKFFILK